MNSSFTERSSYRDRHLPDWLYAALPYLYVCVGLFTIASLHNGIAIFSGVTLMLAGVTVWMVRYQYRREFREIEENSLYRQTVMNADPRNVDLVQIAWRSSYECGNPLIDEQHRRLFALGNQLINAALNLRPKQEIEVLLDALVEQIWDHFCTEEAALARVRHPFFEEHKISHRALWNKAKGLRDRYHDQQLEVSELIGFLVYDVVTQHIIKEDLKFAVEAI